jgi:ABC-type branched-subunit amino acid transport system ATPase component
MSIVLEIQGVVKNFNGLKALDDFSCSVQYGEILGLIGPNGAGKTTLFNIISGFLDPDFGTILFKGKDIINMSTHQIVNIGISRTFQNLRLIYQISALENVLLSFKRQPGEQLRNVFFNWKHSLKQEKENREEASLLINEVGLANKLNDPTESLSYGQQKLLSLVCCFAAKSELVLLDEPVAGIAPEMTEKILKIIQKLPTQGTTVIMIEHNIDAIMQVCDRIIFMDAGTKVSEGAPEAVKNDPRVIHAYID